jgi:hypothetical protein
MVQFLLLLFWWDWSLNSGLLSCTVGTLLLEPHLQFINRSVFDHECHLHDGFHRVRTTSYLPSCYINDIYGHLGTLYFHTNASNITEKVSTHCIWDIPLPSLICSPKTSTHQKHDNIAIGKEGSATGK